MIGSFLCAVSHDFTHLLVGRSIQGIGGGGITALTSVLLADMIDLRNRGKWSGVVNCAHALGTVIGPLLSAAFTEYISWRWLFWINLPLSGFGVIFLIMLFENDFQFDLWRSELLDLDYLGIFLFIASLTPFIAGLSWGGVLYEWKSWRTILPLILGFLGLIGFIIYEAYIARNPFIPPMIFTSKSTCINLFGIFTFGLVLWGLMYSLALYYEGVKLFSIIHTGSAFLPETLTIVPVGIVVSVLISLTGEYCWPLWFGWAVTTLGLGLLLRLNVETSTIGWVFPNIIVGLGTGAVYPAIQLAIQASAPEEVMAMTVTMISSFRNLGRAVGVAIGGVILQNRLEYYLQNEPLLKDHAQQYSRDASVIPQIIQSMANPAQREALRHALARSLVNVSCCLLGFSSIAFLGSFFVTSYNMDRKRRSLKL